MSPRVGIVALALVALMATPAGIHAQFSSCSDPDGDGVCSDADNCPTLSNPEQESVFRLSDPASVGIKLGNPYVISPDNSTVAYVDRTPEYGQWRLNLVRFDEAIPAPITMAAGVISKAFEYVFTSDSTRLVYTRYPFGTSHSQLYSAPVTGGPAVRLSGDAELRIDEFEVCQDGTKVLYREDNGQNLERYFRIVPSAGGTPVDLMGPAEMATHEGAFAVSPDCSTAVLQFFDGTSSLLYSVPTVGGPAVPLHETPVPRFETLDFRISPNGSTVVFRTDEETNGVVELFSVPIAGGSVTKISGTMVSGGDAGTRYAITGDSATVVYIADQDVDGVDEIYSVRITGGRRPTKLNDPLVAGGDVRHFDLDPTGGTVLFTADAVVDQTVELYSVPATGGTAIRLNGALTPGGAVYPFAFSPDGSTVLYRADQDVADMLELYSVPILGGTTTSLNGPLPPGGSVSGRFGTGDGVMAAYSADESVDGQTEVYSTPVVGGGSTRISAPLVAGETVSLHSLRPDGQAVAYSAGVRGDETIDALYAAPVVADADSDGILLFCDCAPLDPSVAEVAEVDGVAVEKLGGGVSQLSWPAATGADSYSVSRGLLDAVPAGDLGACLDSGIVDLFLDDADPPLPGQVFVYLVQSKSDVCGAGMLGRDSGGTKRSNANPAACS